jgi:glycosyltransferase involved in cell wall biosynthesis
MSAPRVSVVIPVYNGERYLAATIESVLAQTRPPDEVIVVDDGSTDGSAQIAERYATRGVRCHSQANAGGGAARNRGIALSRGDFIAFLDADDLWEPVKLQLQLDAFAAEPSLDLVFGRVSHFVSPDLDPEEAGRLVCPPGLHPGYLTSALLARSEAMERVGSFREDLTVGEFVDWMARARELGLREAMLPDRVFSRRLHKTNQGVVHGSDRSDFARVVKAALERRRAADAFPAAVDKPRLCITFDDGPDPEWTPRVLDELAAAGARATFFVIAPAAVEHAAIVERALDEGHAIEFHCTEHLSHGEIGREQAERDVRDGLRMLRERFGEELLSVWRPPYGATAPWQEEVAADAGLQLITWDVDTRDWTGRPAEEMLADARPALFDGAVVLMHDGSSEGGSSRAETVRLVRMLSELAGGFDHVGRRVPT